MNNSTKLGATLYDLRRKAGMSQEELADKLGVSRQAVSKWECGDSMPDTDNLITISKLYSISLDELVGNTAAPAPVEQALAQSEADDVVILGKGDTNKFTRLLYTFPYPVFITIVFLLWGLSSWGKGFVVAWTLFVTIPIYYSIVTCIKAKRLTPFNYPVFITFVYLLIGMQWGLWHPWWILFITIPIFYPIASAIDRK
jgi:transcriptional regulator with XRE-family HTH domain